MLGQHAQDALDIALDAALARLPIDALDVGRKGRDLEIVFDIDRQRIRKGGGQHDSKFLLARRALYLSLSPGDRVVAFTSFCSKDKVCKLMRSKRSRLRSRRCNWSPR